MFNTRMTSLFALNNQVVDADYSLIGKPANYLAAVIQK